MAPLEKYKVERTKVIYEYRELPSDDEEDKNHMSEDEDEKLDIVSDDENTNSSD